MKNIFIAGSGVLGTAMAQAISIKQDVEVTVLSIEGDVVESINKRHRNEKYFPLVALNKSIKAVTDNTLLKGADCLFICIPSVSVIDFMVENKNVINNNCIVVNMAKGFGSDNETLHEAISKVISHDLCTMKGPSFARDIVHLHPTAFTFGCENEYVYRKFEKLFENTSIYLDYTDDIRGVEMLSALKNIYAIAMGISDALYDSPNMRFLLLTKAFNEMHNLLIKFGGKSETIFKYCGVGDLCLTALNDMSRNRTLGLLIGKGFYSSDIADKVVLEGRIALNVVCEKLGNELASYPIMYELNNVFNNSKSAINFIKNILNKI